MDYEMFDDYIAYNEVLKQSVTWCIYGDSDEYFLSKVYDFEDDFLSPINEERTLINVKIDNENNTLDNLIKRSLNMVF